MNKSVSEVQQAIFDAYPLGDILQQCGVQLIGSGVEKTALCPFHAEKNPSFGYNSSKQVWTCRSGGCGGGTVIDFLAKHKGIDPRAMFAQLAQELEGQQPARRPRVVIPKVSPKPEKEPKEVDKYAGDGWPKPGVDQPVAVYQYHDLFGSVAFEVCRYQRDRSDKPEGYQKTFKQRSFFPDGSYNWKMEGVERVLYRLPKVAASKIVFACEGEKDVHTFELMGYVATTSAGGAKGWKEGYAESFIGKDVAICGDNDEPGRGYIKDVFDSAAKKAKSVRIIRLPETFGDITEFVAAQSSLEAAKAAVEDMFLAATPFVQGYKLPLFSMVELEQNYKTYVSKLSTASLNLSGWLPSLHPLRRVVPGELVFFLGGTGCGKTSLLLNLALRAAPMTTLFFELELPETVLFERLVGMKNKMSGYEVEQAYVGEDFLGEKVLQHHFPSIYICSEAKVTIEQIEAMILRSELKTGTRPQIVLLDYVQLISGKGGSRYERVSNVAEDLKMMAKSTQTIVVCASQIGRKGADDSKEVNLHDAKQSGEIENSSGLVIGAWRDEEDPTLMTMRVLKSTKGGAGLTIPCNYDTRTLLITERTRN